MKSKHPNPTTLWEPTPLKEALWGGGILGGRIRHRGNPAFPGGLPGWALGAQPGGYPSRCSLVTGAVRMLEQAPGPHIQLFGGAQQHFIKVQKGKKTRETPNVWTTDNDG